jgi:hypothetical protein
MSVLVKARPFLAAVDADLGVVFTSRPPPVMAAFKCDQEVGIRLDWPSPDLSTLQLSACLSTACDHFWIVDYFGRCYQLESYHQTIVASPWS